jgi:hypothetical protein
MPFPLQSLFKPKLKALAKGGNLSVDWGAESESEAIAQMEHGAWQHDDVNVATIITCIWRESIFVAL